MFDPCILCRRIWRGVMLVLLLAHTAFAGSTWETSGPDGASVIALAMAPSDPSILYAGTSAGGVFVSTDGAAHWTRRGVRGLAMVRAIAVHPTDPRIAYVGSNGAALAKTTDGGVSWTELVATDVFALAIDPNTRPSSTPGRATGSLRALMTA